MRTSPDGRCTLISGGRSAPDRAALYTGALVRYLDFNDSYLAARETCHPSDTVAAVLAAAELANADGATLLVALAVAYEVQCRLSDAVAGSDVADTVLAEIASAVRELEHITVAELIRLLRFVGAGAESAALDAA